MLCRKSILSGQGQEANIAQAKAESYISFKTLTISVFCTTSLTKVLTWGS